MATGIAHSRIHVLPDDLIGRIAAGEVVERPAAVVKELIDNSLDAGATRITIEVEDAGLARIRVIDDGEGMTRDEAVLAFRRHATSKLTCDRDLWAIRTLGFRGEALPSIAAVAKIQLVTTVPGAEVGTCCRVQGGAVQAVEDVAAPVGTQVDVQELFFNTPARKKFLKSATTEFSHILQVVQQACLSWPNVQFRLVRHGQEMLHYAAVTCFRDRLLQIYRGEAMAQMVPVERQGPGLRVEGIAIRAEHLRASRTPQEIFVNRRAVKNPTILHAVSDAYGPLLPKGRYPQFVLFLDVDPARVDVNVHPTKREVRFADNELVHRTVRQAVKDALSGGGDEGSTGASAGASMARVIDESLRAAPRWSQPAPRIAEATVGGGGFSAGGAMPLYGDEARPESRGVAGAAVGPGRDEVVPLGQIDHTYLVACVGSELQVIDQHTAHERVLYERLWRGRHARAVEAQTLLVPVPIDVPPHQRVLLAQHAEELERLGLGIEPFGSDAFLLRTVPAVLGATDGTALVQALLDDMEEWRTYSSMDATMHPVIATLACHSAVRAGRHMALPEIARLVQDWAAEGMIMTCPHGRRVALRLPMDELARIFGRL